MHTAVSGSLYYSGKTSAGHLFSGPWVVDSRGGGVRSGGGKPVSWDLPSQQGEFRLVVTQRQPFNSLGTRLVPPDVLLGQPASSRQSISVGRKFRYSLCAILGRAADHLVVGHSACVAPHHNPSLLLLGDAHIANAVVSL